jgi:hypothetical protein
MAELLFNSRSPLSGLLERPVVRRERRRQPRALKLLGIAPATEAPLRRARNACQVPSNALTPALELGDAKLRVVQLCAAKRERSDAERRGSLCGQPGRLAGAWMLERR